MFTRITLRFSIAFLLGAVLFIPLVTKLEAQDQSPRQDHFVAHEWGTFTSVSTADGRPQLWNPLVGPSELPSFVYRSLDASQCFKSGPLASVTRQTIDWNGFVAQPGAKEKFPVDRSRSHYYPARETDAAPLSLGDEQRVEQERFLFYRGIGFFDLPLSARLKDDQVVVRDAGPDEVAQVILFENRGGRSGWRIHGPLKGEAAI